MPYKDPQRAKLSGLERSRRYRARQREMFPKPPPGKHGNHARGERNGRWNNGKLISSEGYVLVRVPKNHHRAFGSPGLSYGYAYEHDLIMEASIGRRLESFEVVHHENEDKQDNSIGNLKLKTRSAHAREHDIVRGRNEFGQFRRVRQFPV